MKTEEELNEMEMNAVASMIGFLNPFDYDIESDTPLSISPVGMTVYNVQSPESRVRDPSPFIKGKVPEWAQVTLHDAGRDKKCYIIFHNGVADDGRCLWNHPSSLNHPLENFEEVAIIAKSFLED